MVKSAGSDLTDLQAFIGTQKKISYAPPCILNLEFFLTDVENVFSLEDKLSQVNTLMQMENIASYPFMQKCIQAKQTQIHAMWYDIHSGEVYLFSKAQKVSVISMIMKTSEIINLEGPRYMYILSTLDISKYLYQFLSKTLPLFFLC